MKNFGMKDSVEGMQLMKGIKISWCVVIQYSLVATLIFIGMVSQTKTCHANGTAYAISLTPHIDPVTGNSKVSIDSYRGLNAHVVSLPNHAPVSGVTVTFSTLLGSLSSTSGTTNSNGDVGTTLSSGWTAGSAKVYAFCTIDTNYSDEVTISVVKPDGQNTFRGGWYNQPGKHTYGLWQFQLTPLDVDFSPLTVTESDGGIVDGGDKCWFKGSKYDPFQAVTGAGDPFGTIQSNSQGINYATEDDGVGWSEAMVTYYRNQPSVPYDCATHFKQYMNVIRSGGSNIKYYSDILGAGIQPVDVTSLKAGLTQSKAWQ